MNLDNILLKARICLPSSIRTRLTFSIIFTQSNPKLGRNLERIGTRVGLNDYEVQHILSAPPIAGQQLPPPTSPFSKFCISIVLFLIISFFLFITIFWGEVLDLPNPLYIPGTRYGTVKSLDFREIS